MKITFNRKAFLDAMAIGGSYAGNKQVLPILECVRLTFSGQTCWIMSYNDRDAIKTSCEVIDIDGNDGFCVSSKGIQDYVRLIPDDNFSITFIPGETTVTISSINGDFKMPVFDVNEFPTPSIEKDAPSFKMDAAMLCYWIRTCSPFLVKDDLKPYRSHIHLFVSKEKVKVWACEEHIAYNDAFDIENEMETTLGIHLFSFPGILKAYNGEEFLIISSGEKGITIKGEKTLILLRKYEMGVPCFDVLTRPSPMAVIKVDRKALFNSMQRALTVYQNPEYSITAFNFSDDRLNLVTEDLMMSGKLLNETHYVEDGVNITQYFKPNLFGCCLNALTSDEVHIMPAGEKIGLRMTNPTNNEVVVVMPYSKP